MLPNNRLIVAVLSIIDGVCGRHLGTCSYCWMLHLVRDFSKDRIDWDEIHDTGVVCFVVCLHSQRKRGEASSNFSNIWCIFTRWFERFNIEKSKKVYFIYEIKVVLMCQLTEHLFNFFQWYKLQMIFIYKYRHVSIITLSGKKDTSGIKKQFFSGTCKLIWL